MIIENTLTDKSLSLFSKYIHLINNNLKIILLLYNFLFILTCFCFNIKL